MTVNELIKELQKIKDKDQEVTYRDYSGPCYYKTSVDEVYDDADCETVELYFHR